MLVFVADDEADGSAGGDQSLRRALGSRHHSGEKFHAVAFLAGCGETALTRTTAIEFRLNEVEVQFQTSRTAVDDAADGCAVTFAERGETEKSAEGVQG